MKLDQVNQILGIASKVSLLIPIVAFGPAVLNEWTWLTRNKQTACSKVQSEYEVLVASASRLNTRAFSPGDGSAINQAFLGTVLASSTQSPNAKLIQATIYGCPTDSYSLQLTSW